MSAADSELVRELEESSRALLEALRERNPGYLEHLDRRQRALLALNEHTWEESCEDDLRRLQLSQQLGQEAELAVRGIREHTRRKMLSLNPQKGLARALEEQFGPSYSSLNVKA